MKKSKWQREQEIKQDKAQTRLINSQNNEINKNNLPKQVNYKTKVYCPLCLYYGELISFKIDGKTKYSGENTYRMKCPECKNIVLLPTLKSMVRMTKSKIIAYAKWVYNNRRRFWSIVDKEKWNSRMKELKWNGIFWSTYRKIKAELKRPDYVYNEEDEYAEVREQYLKEKEERFKRGDEY